VDIDVRTFREHVGEELAISDWVAISQETIAQFADATGDHQWIHLDAARAAKESPFKTTIAHGFLTLSLISALLRSAVNPIGLRMAINYGLNRVRFIAPVPSGSRVRGRFTVASVDAAGDSIQVTWSATIERVGVAKPVCVAEWIVRYYPDQG
jgi:acyl dehydratase